MTPEELLESHRKRKDIKGHRFYSEAQVVEMIKERNQTQHKPIDGIVSAFDDMISDAPKGMKAWRVVRKRSAWPYIITALSLSIIFEILNYYYHFL